jgi:hypothetical protein
MHSHQRPDCHKRRRSTAEIRYRESLHHHNRPGLESLASFNTVQNKLLHLRASFSILKNRTN